uniref:Uncharacterized protein n=1 Tax=Anguilla anguilla TaxID=7936 RepID=A0A0E9UWL8_ANGAN
MGQRPQLQGVEFWEIPHQFRAPLIDFRK